MGSLVVGLTLGTNRYSPLSCSIKRNTALFGKCTRKVASVAVSSVTRHNRRMSQRARMFPTESGAYQMGNGCCSPWKIPP